MKSPEPPEELTTTQAGEWRAITAGLSGEWFPPPTRPLLIQFCRDRCMSEVRVTAVVTVGSSDDRN